MRSGESRALYLAGSGSFAVEVAEWARDGGWDVVGLVELLDSARAGTRRGGLPVISPDDAPPGGLSVLAIGGPRHELWSRMEAHGWEAATVVHPTAHVSPTARLGSGCIVGPGAVIGAETSIDAHTLLSRGALIGHHSHIGAFVSLMPGTNVGGHAAIGDRCILGMGAVVVNNINVAPDTTVAAGAVVVRDTRAYTRVQGVPAREYTA